jgi:hypothetical protein
MDCRYSLGAGLAFRSRSNRRVGVLAFVTDQKAETLVCTRGPNFPVYGWSRGVWIPVLTSAMIFARRMLPMMSFSIIKARL